MKFAYHKEQEANHRREEEEAVDSSSSAAAAAASAASAAAAAAAVDDFESIPDNLGELKLRSSSASPTGTDGGGESCRAADPFQCIGCCVVFAHKPGLKAHQACADDKERPFRCCKCGYKFRQKAHLQKHQWRIHRRRYCDQVPILFVCQFRLYKAWKVASNVKIKYGI
jgi:hypothetical protein